MTAAKHKAFGYYWAAYKHFKGVFLWKAVIKQLMKYFVIRFVILLVRYYSVFRHSPKTWLEACDGCWLLLIVSGVFIVSSNNTLLHDVFLSSFFSDRFMYSAQGVSVRC